MVAPSPTRKSIPLGEDEITLAERVRTPGTPERAAVEDVLGPLPGNLSEAQALARLLAVAGTTVQAKVTEQSYAAYAAALEDEDRAFAAASRSRRSDRAALRATSGRE